MRLPLVSRIRTSDGPCLPTTAAGVALSLRQPTQLGRYRRSKSVTVQLEPRRAGSGPQCVGSAGRRIITTSHQSGLSVAAACREVVDHAMGSAQEAIKSAAPVLCVQFAMFWINPTDGGCTTPYPRPRLFGDASG